MGGNWGDGNAIELVGLLTSSWFEGRMFSDGETGAICCCDVWREVVARKWGDGGTELRSGISCLACGKDCGTLGIWILLEIAICRVKGRKGELRSGAAPGSS